MPCRSHQLLRSLAPSGSAVFARQPLMNWVTVLGSTIAPILVASCKELHTWPRTLGNRHTCAQWICRRSFEPLVALIKNGTRHCYAFARSGCRIECLLPLAHGYSLVYRVKSY